MFAESVITAFARGQKNSSVPKFANAFAKLDRNSWDAIFRDSGSDCLPIEVILTSLCITERP
jgi:hypothetical protein